MIGKNKFQIQNAAWQLHMPKDLTILMENAAQLIIFVDKMKEIVTKMKNVQMDYIVEIIIVQEWLRRTIVVLKA